jgi:hypothetical protein
MFRYSRVWRFSLQGSLRWLALCWLRKRNRKFDYFIFTQNLQAARPKTFEKFDASPKAALSPTWLRFLVSSSKALLEPHHCHLNNISESFTPSPFCQSSHDELTQASHSTSNLRIKLRRTANMSDSYVNW